MFCVHCGAAEQTEKAYCKRCGKWLGAAPPEKRMIVTLVFSAISAVFGAASAIALYATFLGTKAAPAAVYVAAAFCCVISVHQTISFFFQLELLRRLKQSRGVSESSAVDRQFNQHAPVARALGAQDTSAFIRQPSVVEGTTELLEKVSRGSGRSASE
jgi:hypothetical protein